MISFPNCKINLGLHIIRKRDDGYHDLQTVFYPLPLHDVLEVITDNSSRPSSRVSGNSLVQFKNTGLPINGSESKNLCVKAYEILKEDFPALPAIHIYLHKAVPIGAGLGGGSADGSFTLKILNDKYQLRLSTEQLLDYALRLGSDCPFFILNEACLATGRGEFLHKINVNLSSCSFLLINPGIHISTDWAFKQLLLTSPPKSLKEVIQETVSSWKENLANDFEKPIFDHYPELRKVKSSLYQSGAIYASLSGTGSSLYGIYPKNQLPILQLPANYHVIQIR